MWIDTHLLDKKIEATYGTKDDPVSSHIRGAPSLNPRPRLPQKFLLRVVVTQIPKPRYPKPIFLSSLSESRGRDYF
jgi:hypothetical protein